MTATTPGLGRPTADGRFARFAEQVREVRSRARFSRPDNWMLVVGGALMPLGGVLILLGWLGASRTPLAFEQTPYLISGGLLGLALVIAGGFLYFGYWQTVRIRESRQQTHDLTAALARLESLLTAAGGDRAQARPSLVATPNGSIFHRTGCTVVAGRADLRDVDPARDDLAPCRICEPLADHR